ncbi:MAG: gliding motility-associated C-terminal domain-containing protein [Bacteroidetes bacterium]|nr:gliding motility-associated C-terminal domain-containing protein [Bacteroidota bacterium]
MKIKIQYLKILIAIFSIANSFNARSQTFYKQIGNPQLNEGGQVIIPTNDGNYLVGGYKEDSALIIKISPQGSIIWSTTFMPSAGSNVYYLSYTADGNIIGCGIATNSSAKKTGFYFKLDLNGNLQWLKVLNDTRNIFCQRIESKVSSEYLLFCNISTLVGPTLTDPILLRINSTNGNIIATTPRYNFYSPISYIDEIYSTTKGYGNFYYATGRSYFQGSASQGMRPTFTKFNNLGNIQFSKYLLYSITANARIYGIDIVYSNDSLLIGYFGDKITGTSTNYSVGIIKTDTAANVIWSKDYNITSSTNEYSYKVLVTNYGYAIVGYMPGAVNKNFYIIAVNKVGNLLWAKSYGTSAVEDILYTNTPIACSEGSTIYFTGRTTTSNGKMDLVIVKVDSLGNTNCNTGVTLSINVTTNPTNSNSCTLSTAIDNLVFTSVNNSNQNTVIDPCSTTLLNLGNDTTVCDSIILNATLPGTNQYFWSNGSTQSTIKIFSPGTYWVNVFSNCCMYTDTIHILNSLSLPVATISGNTSICKGDSTNLLVSGGSSYLWNNGATDSLLTVKPIVTTMYTVVAKNGSCSSVPDTVIVTVLQPPLFNLIGDSISCNSSSVQLIAICPTAQTTHWSPGILSTNDTITVSSNIPGYFSAYVFDGTCNSQPDSIWVDTLSSPTLSASFIPLSCINDTVQFSSVTNSTSLVWNFGHTASGASNTSNLSNPSHIYTSAGNFTINLVAQNYCGSTSFNSPITIQSGPPVSLTNDTTICKGNSISLIASGGTNYQWSGAVNSTASSVLVSPLVNSTYLVKTSNGSCFGPLDSVTVSVAVQPLISLVGDSISCNSGPVQLIANCPSAQAIHWSSGISSTNDTIAVSTGFPAFISAYAFDGICNSKLDSIWVDTLSSPTLNASFITLSCMNDTVHFSSITNATSLTWNFGHTASGASNTSNLSNPSHIYTSAGNFTINLVAQNYCGSTSYASPITVQVGPQVQVPNDTTICKGQSVNLIAAGGTNYVWDGAISSNASSVLVAPLVTSTYIVKASNGTCFGIPDTIVVNPIDKPIVLVSGIDTVCNSELITLTATGASTYFWNGASGTSVDTIQVAPNVNSIYSVVGAIGACLSDTSFFKVTVSNISHADYSYSLDTCSGEILFLNKSSLANSYKWIFGDSYESSLMHPVHTYSESGTFQTMLITNPGKSCSDTLVDEIKYEQNPEGYLFIPNAFTPDGDGLNDVFTVNSFHNCNLLKLEIYDRWGVLIFQTQGYQVSWNGRSNGFQVPVGVYVYVVNFNDTEKIGSITLFR